VIDPQGSAAPDVTPQDLAAWARHLRAERPADALVAELTSTDLPTAFARTAADSPDSLALSVDGPWRTHGELARLAARVHAVLVARGVVAGDRVLLCGATSDALVVAYLGLLRAGAVVVLADPGDTRSELEHLVTDSGARLAMADAEPAARLEDLVDVLVLGATLPDAEEPEPVVPGSDAVAMIAYTSGTTGAPKGVPLTHANLLSSIRAAMLAWSWSPSDVLVHALPLSHQHGLGGVHATLLAGSRVVVRPRFDPDDLADTAERHRASVLFAVPAMYERLVSSPAARRLGASLRLAVCGSAPSTPDLAARVAATLGRAPLERYGSTEAGLDVSLPLDGPGAPGMVGLPLPGVQMRLTSPTGGEVLLRGPQVFTGYWNNPSATAEAFDEQGWFRTGDLGVLDPGTGYLRLTGRLKELIITGGMNVAPREVELALDDHPAVAEVAVAGLASGQWGEQVTAWVVATPGRTPTEDELLAHAGERLAPHKRPKRVYVVDELPRNRMGKVQRHELRPPTGPAAEVDTTDLDRALDRLRRADP